MHKDIRRPFYSAAGVIFGGQVFGFRFFLWLGVGFPLFGARISARISGFAFLAPGFRI